MMEDFEQINIFGAMSEKKAETALQEIATELFQDATPISAIERQGILINPTWKM